MHHFNFQCGNRLLGEEERQTSFRRTLRECYPKLGIVEESEGPGRDMATGLLVREAVARKSCIPAGYSIGGDNTAIAAFKALGRQHKGYFGPDLDHEIFALLRKGAISSELHDSPVPTCACAASTSSAHTAHCPRIPECHFRGFRSSRRTISPKAESTDPKICFATSDQTVFPEPQCANPCANSQEMLHSVLRLPIS